MIRKNDKFGVDICIDEDTKIPKYKIMISPLDGDELYGIITRFGIWINKEIENNEPDIILPADELHAISEWIQRIFEITVTDSKKDNQFWIPNSKLYPTWIGSGFRPYTEEERAKSNMDRFRIY